VIEIRQLERLGYVFNVQNGRINYTYKGNGTPDPATVDPLLLAIRDRRSEALDYLADAIVLIEDLPAWRQSRGLVLDPAQCGWANGRPVLAVTPERV
jgi:hypothetical protein